MTTMTPPLIRWGVLANHPHIDRTGTTPVTRLRLLRTNTGAIAADATELDASRIIDVTVSGELPEVTLGVAEVGDRVHITTGQWQHRPGHGHHLQLTPEQISFPLLYE